jgi:glutaminase
LEQEAYLNDLKDESDFRRTFYQRVSQEIAAQNTLLAAAAAETDEHAVITAVIAWMTERQAHLKEEMEHATKRYEEEFAIRQKQIEEENFFADMDKKQKEVDKLWTETGAMHEALNLLWE